MVKVRLIRKGNTMTNRKFSALPLVSISLMFFSSFGLQTALGEADIEETFRAKTNDIARAYTENDTDFLTSVYSDDFLMTAQSLHVVTKNQLLENQRFDEGTTFEISDWRAISSGDTVVVLYKQTWNDSDGGSNEVRFTDVWVKEGGDWLILSTHATQISLE